MAFRWRREQKRRGAGARPPVSRGAAIGVCVAFLLVGLVPMTVYGSRAIREAHARLTWRAVPCEIIESRRRDDDDDDAKAGRLDHRRLYRVRVVYRYAPDGGGGGGEMRTSDAIHLRPFRTTDRGAAKLLRAYPRGSRHTCYVDPADPARAALRPINPGSIGWVVVATPWVLIGAAGLRRAVRMG